MSGSVRLRALVEYDGSDFVGWQRQRRGRTVQGELEARLAEVTGEAVVVVGAGRTDAGVHAAGQVAHFDTSWGRTAEELRRAMNAALRRDLVVRRLEEAARGFHARHSATSRVYDYALWAHPTRSPLRRRTSLHVRGALDVAAMARAARSFVGVHDFAAFGRSMTPGGPTTRPVETCAVRAVGRRVVVRVEANAFLRHQVRRMVGLLVDVGLGREAPDAVAAALAAPAAAGPRRRVAAQGLVLVAVRYPDVATDGQQSGEGVGADPPMERRT